MQKFVMPFLFCFVLTSSYGQTQKKVSTYLLTQYNRTIYDRTIGNNPWGAGAGVQVNLNTKTKFKPIIEFTGDIYLEDDKLLILNPDGTVPEDYNDVRSMVNLFIGASFQTIPIMYFSLAGGPSFISGRTRFGIKPSLGFYFSRSQRWTGKISYINVFSRDKTTREDFGSLSFAVGFKLF